MKKLGILQETVMTEGWQEIKRQAKEKMDGAMLQLANVMRPEQPSDDALRGLITGLKWVIDLESRLARAVADLEEERRLDTDEPAKSVGSPMEAEPVVPTE